MKLNIGNIQNAIKNRCLERGWAGALALALAVSGSTSVEAAGAADGPSPQARLDSRAVAWETEDDRVPEFDSTTTVDDYVVAAMKRNPGLRAAYSRWIADVKKSDYAGSFPDPMFSYSYYIESVETRVGPQEQRFGVSQSFPWFGTLGAREDMSAAQAEATYQRFEAVRLELAFDVKAAYYDYYYLGRDILITRENLELLTFWESVAQTKYKVGLQKHPDIIKAQVELGKLEDHLITLQEQRSPKAAHLRALLNLPEDTLLPVPSAIAVVETPLAPDSVIRLILERNPSLQAREHILESERAGERLAGKLAFPSFTIGMDYIQTGEALNPDMLDSGKDPWMVGASVSLPIWFGKNSARKEEAEARRKSAEYSLRDTRNELTAMVERLLFEYSDALRKTRLYREGLVPKAEQSLNAAYAAYQAGETDFLNVLDAQRQLLNFQLTVAREQVRLATRRAQLEMLGGTELDVRSQQ